MSNQFADKEVKSSYMYPKGYKVKGIMEQTNILRQLFPGIGFADEKLTERPLPVNAKGWFAIPKWETVAKDYGKALEKVLALIGKSRTLKNWREGQLGEKYLRQLETTEQSFVKLYEKQDSDIIIIPAQFGLRHRGRSVRRAREVFADNEFGLGSFAIGCMLLTHPEREQVWKQLHIDCAGDEYAPGGDGWFVDAPFFHWRDGGLHFSTGWTSNAGEHYGSASGFVPQK